MAVRHFLSVTPTANADVTNSITEIVAATSGLPIANLESWERKIRWELWRVEYKSPSPKWKFWKKRRSRLVSWLDLFSGDGFRRERTLRTLSEGAPNGFFFSVAIRRLNDWVPQVRVAAREHLPLIAGRSDPNGVVDALWAILPHCSSWGRMREEDGQALAQIVAIEQVALALKSKIISSAVGPAATILAQAGRASALDCWLGEIARDAVQPAVRAKAYRCQLEGRMTWASGREWKWIDKKWCKGRFEPTIYERTIPVTSSFQQTLGAAIGDPSPMVRRVGGEMLIRELQSIGSESRSLAEVLASDSSPSVAERGRYALTQLSGGT